MVRVLVGDDYCLVVSAPVIRRERPQAGFHSNVVEKSVGIVFAMDGLHLQDRAGA